MPETQPKPEAVAVIGRFQALHTIHMELILEGWRTAQAHGVDFIVCLGSDNRLDALPPAREGANSLDELVNFLCKNPLSAADRERDLRASLRHAGLTQEQVDAIKFTSFTDYRNQDKWVYGDSGVEGVQQRLAALKDDAHPQGYNYANVLYVQYDQGKDNYSWRFRGQEHDAPYTEALAMDARDFGNGAGGVLQAVNITPSDVSASALRAAPELEINRNAFAPGMFRRDAARTTLAQRYLKENYPAALEALGEVGKVDFRAIALLRLACECPERMADVTPGFADRLVPQVVGARAGAVLAKRATVDNATQLQ